MTVYDGVEPTPLPGHFGLNEQEMNIRCETHTDRGNDHLEILQRGEVKQAVGQSCAGCGTQPIGAHVVSSLVTRVFCAASPKHENSQCIKKREKCAVKPTAGMVGEGKKLTNHILPFAENIGFVYIQSRLKKKKETSRLWGGGGVGLQAEVVPSHLQTRFTDANDLKTWRAYDSHQETSYRTGRNKPISVKGRSL